MNEVTEQEQHRLLAEYWKTGYLHVPQVFTQAEVASFQQESDRLTTSLTFKDTPGVPLRTTLSGERIRDRLDPVMAHSPVFRAVAQDARIQRWVSAILQDQAYLFKDKLILKPPGTAGYELHQDYAYYRQTELPPDAIVSVQISLDAACAKNGSIIFYPHLHHRTLPAPQGNPLDVDPAAVHNKPRHATDTAAGDIVLFHSLTPHCSEFNQTLAARRTLYLTYSGCRYGNQYTNYYQKRKGATVR